MPIWLQAGLWGLLAGGALMVGALIAWFVHVPRRVSASIMVLDGIPESIVLGLSLLGGKGVGIPVLAAIVISNLPEGLSSVAGMIPEAFERTHLYSGLITTLGFLTAFAISRAG